MIRHILSHTAHDGERHTDVWDGGSTVVSWRGREKAEGAGLRSRGVLPYTQHLQLAVKDDSKPNKRIMAPILTQESVCIQPRFFLFFLEWQRSQNTLNTSTPEWQIGGTQCAHHFDEIDQKRRSKQEWR